MPPTPGPIIPPAPPAIPPVVPPTPAPNLPPAPTPLLPPPSPTPSPVPTPVPVPLLPPPSPVPKIPQTLPPKVKAERVLPQLPLPPLPKAERSPGVSQFVLKPKTKPAVQGGNTDALLEELRLISKVLREKPATAETTVEKNVQVIADLLTDIDSKYASATNDILSVMDMMLVKLETIAKAAKATTKVKVNTLPPESGPEAKGVRKFFNKLFNRKATTPNESTPESDEEESLDERVRRIMGERRKSYTSLADHLKGATLETYDKAKIKAKQTKDATKAMWEKHSPTAKKKVEETKSYLGTKLTDLRGKLKGYYGDVIVAGERIPRLRATLLKAGEYRDKVTGRVITSLEDITGDIVDSAGNTVITIEEYYESYISGSVNKKVKDVFSSVKNYVMNAKNRLQAALPGTIRNLKDKAHTALTKLKDLLPAYDVYVKTDMTRPLLYAASMKYEIGRASCRERVF